MESLGLEKELTHYAFFRRAASLLQTDEPTVAKYGALAFVALLVVADFPLHVISNLVIILLPAKESSRLIARGRFTSDRRDLRAWLTYWFLFAVVVVGETFALASLLRSFPFWWACRTGFFAWAQAGNARGAGLVYSRLVLPLLKPHRVTPSSYE